MNRISIVLAAVLALPACDSGEKATKQAAADKTKNAKAEGTKAADAKDKTTEAAKAKPSPEDQAAAKAKAWQETLKARVLADSGIDVGGKIRAFQIVNGESGEEYCQVCSFGANPKLMLVGSADDEAFKKDLKDLDAIVKKYGEDKLKAFAVVAELENGKAVTPKDIAKAQARAKALRTELGVTMPVVVPAQVKGGDNKEWDYYNITASRTVMFANGRNEVKWSGVAAADFAALSQAIEATLKG